MEFSAGTNNPRIVSLLEEAYTCRTHNLKLSCELAGEALSLSRGADDTSLIAQSLSHLSLFNMVLGEYDAALQLGEQAIEYFTELKDEKGIAKAKYNIAGVYYKTDNYHLGLVNLIDCITIFRKHNDYHNLSRSHKSLGTIYEYFGDEKNAIKTYEEAIAAAKKAGDLNLESNAYNTLSGIYLKQKNIATACEIIERAIQMKQTTGDTRGLAFSLYGRGKVKMAKKKFAEAETSFKEAISLHIKMGETLGLGMAYHKIAQLYVEMGDLEQAKEAATTGLDFSKAHNIIMVTYKCYFLFYRVFKLENDPVNALKYLELYHQQKEQVINNQNLKLIENYEMIAKMDAIEQEARLQLEKAEIIKKKDLAEHTARVKQDFLSTMSHEIRTPLNAVITIASLLPDKADEEEQHLLDTLRFSANNLLLIINDVLDLTKLDAGKATLEMRPGNLKLLLKNIRNAYDGLAKEKGLALRLNIGEGVAGYYELDEIKTSQILGNLVTNAIKFTDHGQVDITVSRKNNDGDTDSLYFEVKDTGHGIAADQLEEIFNSFSQPRSVTTRKHGGSGLGLAIVKKLIALHESTIAVSSMVDTGSSFYFALELKRAEVVDKAASKQLNALEGKTVLLAEDNMINAMLIRKLLSNWKMQPEHALNGLEAIEKAKLKNYDFILMDIHMPEMDGFEATKVIMTTDNPNRKTPIFALTADVTAGTQEEYIRWFNGFLHKPFEMEKVHDALVKACAVVELPVA